VKNIKHLWKNEEGSVLVVGIFSLALLLGFLGLAMDIGNLVYTKTRMQNAVDAAAYAGALTFNGNAVPPSSADQTAATTQANTILQSNGFPSVTLTPTFPTDATWGGNSVPAIFVTMSQNVPTYFMRVLGVTSVPLKASAEAVLSSSSGPPPPFNYTLFSNLQMGLNGSQTIKGDIHGNGEVDLNGSGNIQGNLEGATHVYINGSGHITGYAESDTAGHVTKNGSGTIDGGIIGGAANVAMPDFSQAIIDAAAATPGNTFTGDKTFNSGQIDSLSGNISATGSVYINGSVNWSGSIIAGGDIIINGSASLSGANQIFLYSKGGSIYLNGSSTFGNSSASVFAYAPSTASGKGQVIFNGSSTLYGRVIANQLYVNGSGNIDGTTSTNITVLPPGALTGGNKKSKIIK
jgi:cytoskeletal protein CcmA (bactofilin family)/Flp pilus assembly protein TadG